MSTNLTSKELDIDHEAQRQLALRRFGVLDTAPEEVFDSITAAIAHICEAPIALISLVDGDRQWFKSALGLDAKQTPREIAFCSHAIENQNELFIIEDATKHELFAANPLVTDAPGIRFYAGSPLVSYDGYAIGTLCVIDREARTITSRQQDALAALSKTVIAIMEERKQLQRVAVDRNSVEDLLQQQLERASKQASSHKNLVNHLISAQDKPCAAFFKDSGVVKINQAWKDNAALGAGIYRDMDCMADDLAAHFQQSTSTQVKQTQEFLDFIERIFGAQNHQITTTSNLR